MKQGQRFEVFHRINRYGKIYLHPCTPLGSYLGKYPLLSRGSAYLCGAERVNRLHSSVSYGAFGKSVCTSDVCIGTAVRSIKCDHLYLKGYHLTSYSGVVMAIVSSKFVDKEKTDA